MSDERRAGSMIGMRLENLRTFVDTEYLDFGRFNFIFGKNSSGKTTLLRAPLLLKQLLNRQAVSDPSEMTLSGPVVDFGSYAEAVHDGNLTNDIRLSFRLDIREELKSVWGEDEDFDLIDKPIINIALHWNKRNARMQASEISIIDNIGDKFLVATRKSPTKFILEIPTSNLYRTISGARELNLRTLRTLLLRLSRGRAHEMVELNVTAFVLFDAISLALVKMHHIGPLRDMPARAYQIDQASSTGYSTISALRMLTGNKRATSLVASALRELGMARNITVSTPAPGYAGIVVTDPVSGRADNLADVGFGVSQVLPIIARIATAEPGAVVLIEQPELHLHPETQGALVDVMIDLANERQVSLIVESHSENMLLRLRRRVAAKKVTASDVRVYVADEGKVRQARIDDRGQIDMSAFPKDFFEEDWLEAIEIARAAQGPA